MLRALSWVHKHRRQIAGVSLAAGGAYAAYVLWKKKCELESICQELMQPGPDETREARVREHFEAAQRESDLLLTRELQKMQSHIASSLDTESFRSRMRADGATLDPQRWNEFTLLITTRAVASLYALALALLMRRIHMNIVARHYVRSAKMQLPAETVCNALLAICLAAS